MVSYRADEKDFFPEGVREISIMTFNVENLFDDRHDPGKNDYGFLPLSYKRKRGLESFCRELHDDGMIRSVKKCLATDWNAHMVAVKMRQVAGTILSYNRGRGADILILQEVENFSVLEQLRKNHLARAGYLSSVLVEGEDFRGIDVAMVSRLPVTGRPVLHRIPFSGRKKTRGILEVSFLLPDGSRLTVFGFHFPSQANSVEYRLKAFRFLNKLHSRVPFSEIVIAAGDCNVTETENTRHGILNGMTDSRWLVSHKIERMNEPGTVYSSWKKTWAFFDIILFSKNLGVSAKRPAKWVVVPGAIAVWSYHPLHKTGKGRPKRFNPYSQSGVSDHWPVTARIKMRD